MVGLMVVLGGSGGSAKNLVIFHGENRVIFHDGHEFHQFNGESSMNLMWTMGISLGKVR